MKLKVAEGILLTLLLTSMLTLAFNIQTVKASGTIYIRADGSVEPDTAPIMSVDNITYAFIDNIYEEIVIERSKITVDGDGYLLQGNGAGYGISLSSTRNVTIRNTNIKDFEYGIYLDSATCNVISKNEIQMPAGGLQHGIYLDNSSDNTISGNDIRGGEARSNADFCVYLEGYSDNNTISWNKLAGSGNGIGLYSPNNTVTGNTITENVHKGIFLDLGSINCTILGNIIINNGNGICLWASRNNTISRNTIETNRGWSGSGKGIYLYGHSKNNMVSENNITNNGYGVYLEEDVRLDNLFYHNNFVDNTVQVEVYGTTANIWDNGYPSGGNYWSNYTGVDQKSGSSQDQPGSDGIGDIPHVINENNQDGFPLMNPWTLPPPEHELAISITAPPFLQLGSSSFLNATVNNLGINDETDVELAILIDGNTVDSTTVPILQADSSYMLSYLWTPTVEETYNITAYAHPLPGEASVENNQDTKFVTVAVSVPEVHVGVKAGDWIKCDYKVTGWPSGTPYPEWLKVEILGVEGTTATAKVTMHMSDGTEPSDTLSVDVVAGGGTFDTLFGFVIPANCSTGDSITMGGDGFTFNVTIDGETQRTYAGASRTLVYASFSQLGSQLTYYWDKQTGIMVEASTTSGGMTGTAKATETNMWEAAPTPFRMQWWLIPIVAVAIVALVGVVYFLKKRKAPTPTAPILSPEQGETSK